MKRRVLTVALAVLLAVLGTGAVLAYVNQADARALAGQQAVEVMVAQQLIPAGTTASAAQREGLLRAEKMPAASVPPNAVRSISADLASLVTSAQVQPGTLLLRPMLVPAALASGGLAVPSGMLAVTVSLCVPEAVAGNIHAGSKVAVFDTVIPGGKSGSVNAQPACSGAHAEQVSGARTLVVLPSVRVLSVGPASASAQGGAQAGAAGSSQGSGNQSGAASSQGTVLVTLAVGPNDAKRLIQLTETGLPYLALLN